MGVGDKPIVEIHRLLVVVIEHLRQYLPVLCVAVWVIDAGQIRLPDILPAVLILLCHASATLGEAGIAHVSVISQDLSASRFHCAGHVRIACIGDALIALAVVIGTDIKDGMVLAVIPTHQHVIVFREREEVVRRLVQLLSALHLGQEP